MNRLTAILFATVSITGCALPRTETAPAGVRSEAERRMIDLRCEAIREMQEEVAILHSNLMIVGETDEKYGAKLKQAWRMPPSEAALRNLPSSLSDLDLMKNQLEMKLKRYRDLLVIGNAGY